MSVHVHVGLKEAFVQLGSLSQNWWSIFLASWSLEIHVHHNSP